MSASREADIRYEAATLDYLRLVEESRSLVYDDRHTAVRLAILAECSTHHLATLLKVLFVRNGIRPLLYEAGYDVIETEILDPGSRLYGFKPDYVVLLPSGEKLKARLYATEDRAGLVTEAAERCRALWDAVRRHSQAVIIQANFVRPSERAFGNYELIVPSSVGSMVDELNRHVVAALHTVKGAYLCDLDHLAGEVGRRNWTDPTLWHLAKLPCRLDHLPLLAQAIVDITLSCQGVFTKCVVLDLDNTLWGGVIGDDGVAGIALGEFDDGEAFVGFQRFLKELRRRGIILAVVSKNEEAAALLPFREHDAMVLKQDDVAVFLANWEDKASNIRRVQAALNIGFESMVFIDDNPFERDLVRDLVPGIVVPQLPADPSLFLDALARHELFETTSYSSADAARPDQYRQEASRVQARAAAVDLQDYLRSLRMTISIERFSSATLPRIAQLVQRSNQFNLTTRRYSEAACEAMMRAGEGCLPLAATLSDRFGDYGLICVAVLCAEAPDELEIDTLLMSCRVLQRGVEQFIMNELVAATMRRGRTRLKGRYRPTEKNRMVREFYAGFGFRQVEEMADGETVWLLACPQYEPRPTCITPLTVET